MNLIFAIVALFVGMSQFSKADPTSNESANVSKVSARVLPVSRTPESDSVLLTITIPKSDVVVAANPMWIQFRIDGYSLGSDSSQFERSNQIAVSDMGQTVHVVIDNQPYFPIKEPAINPFNDEGYYRDTMYKFELPYSLSEGTHTIRMFPARSFGESLKGDTTLHAVTFHLGKAGGLKSNVLSGPYLTYNEPSDQLFLTENQPVLLDFLVTNCELSPDGFKVRLSINGQVNRTLSSWQPYYIYGLSKGKYTIRLELVNEHGHLVPGPFNDVQRTIVIH